MAFANLSIYYTWKSIKLYITTINLKYLLQLGIMNLMCLMDQILFETLKIILNTLSKSMKLSQILPCKFTPIEQKTGLFLK